MTEDEAKTKWCPKAGENRFNRQDEQCLASACAVWRWSEAKRSAAFLEAVQARMQGQSKPNFNTAVQEVYADTGGRFARVEGYCGLAGEGQ